MIDTAREILRDSTRVVAFSGAGLSAESGVPTFRDASAVSGALWSKFDPTTLASPKGFAVQPDVVIEWYNWRRKAIANAKPNPAHHALADFVNVTQNVDDLLERAGATRIHQLHGSIGSDRCNAACGFEEKVSLSNPPGRRSCPKCGQPIRPSVVWFGEMLPTDVWQRAEDECSHCDALLVVGTSAVVYPTAGLVDIANSVGAKIIVVNTQPSAASHLADVELIGKAGEVLPKICLAGKLSK